MTYYSGARNDASNGRKNFIEQVLEPALLDKGWTFVKQWDEGGGTPQYIARTYKNPQANNGSADFFVTVVRDPGYNNGYISLVLHGSFDAATNTIDNFAWYPNGGSAQQSTNVRANGTRNQTFTGVYDIYSQSSNNAQRLVGMPDSGGFTYFLVVEKTHFVLMLPGTVNTYCGLFDKSYTDADTFAPAYIGSLDNTDGSGGSGAVIWNPRVTSAGFRVNPLAAGNRFERAQWQYDVDGISQAVLLGSIWLVSANNNSEPLLRGTWGRLKGVVSAAFPNAQVGDEITTADPNVSYVHFGSGAFVRKQAAA